MKPSGDRHSKAVVDPYELPPEDTEYLDANYPSRWKKIAGGNGKYGLLIEEFPIPGGFSVEKSTLMVLVPSGYPGSMLDMFYFFPPLDKSDGSLPEAVVPEAHFGRTWQRWSRHRCSWQPGIDSIVTHIEYVKNQLSIEVRL